MQKIALLILSMFLSVMFFPKSVYAINWPDKPLNFVVAFGAGGAIDGIARRIAKQMEQQFNVSVNVVNRPGAGGLVGTTYFMGLRDDGQNILFGHQPFYSSTIILQDAPYSFDDISIFSFLYIENECISVKEDSPFKTFDDLVAAIRAKPDTIRMATTSGSIIQALHKNLREQLGLNFKSVYYDSTPEKQAALLGGHLDVTAGGITTALRNGDRILLTMGNGRSPLLPDVPAVNEILKKPINLGGTSVFAGVRSSMKEKYPDRYEWFLDSLYKTVHSPEYIQVVEEAGIETQSVWVGPEKSAQMNREIHESVKEYENVLRGQGAN